MKIKIFWVGFSSIFLIIGLVVSTIGFREMKEAKVSTKWPTTSGVILESKVDSRSDSDSGTSYHAEVLYQFEMDGAKIQGNRISFGEVGTGDASDASRVVNRFPKDTEVTIYYDPKDPFNAVLEPGIQTGTWFLPVFGLVFAGFGAFFMAIGIFFVH